MIKEFVQDELDKKELIEVPMIAGIKKRTVGFAYNPGSVSTAMEIFFEAMQKAGIRG